jgi:hypothetical protein
MAQDIGMQIERLEKIVDSLYNASQSNLGNGHKITKQALKAVLYCQGLKCDHSALVKVEEVVE